MSFHRFVAAFVLFGSLFWPSLTFATMSSTNYKIQWDSFSTGGSDSSSSSSYLLRDTVGGIAPGSSTDVGGTYQNSSGYRSGVNDQVITFNLFSQSTTGMVAASVLSGMTATVADTSDYTPGDYAAVIQDLGASQVVAIGKILSKGLSTLVFDSLTDNGTAPVINGSNDYVVRLNGLSATFGELSSSSVSTEVVGFDVTADVDNGYTIQAVAGGPLTNGTTNISGVSDGTVTAGSAEYGGRSSDTTVSGSTFGTQDTAFTTDFQPVVDKTGHLFSDRSFMTLKASIAPSTASGTYTQALSFIVSGNY